MVFLEKIVMLNCRLCQAKPGSCELFDDKKFIKDIYSCIKLKVNDRCMKSLPKCVCQECKTTIQSFVKYKQNILKVDQCLRKILKNAVNKNNLEEILKCGECPAEFNNQEIFIKHQESHNVDSFQSEELLSQVPCSMCNTVFDNFEAYGEHQCSFSSQGDFKDNSDDEVQNVFDENKEEHLKQQNEQTKFICTYKDCEKVLRSAYTLKTHLLKHQGKRSFLCVICGKAFITKNSLTCHEKIHLEVKGYVCKLCNIGFSVRSNLRAHEKKYHEGVRFYCSQCSRAFISKCGLERHERIHTGIKDFKCQSCPSAFYTRKELLKHQRYHQGVRSHKCDECFKTFFERHHLIIHLRSHTGERPYMCKFPNCGKSFMESQKLKRHHRAKHTQV